MQATKKLDHEFQVRPSSTRHTIRDATSDITSMVNYLREESVAAENPTRKSDPFPDPLSKGSEKIAHGWIEDYLSKCDEPEPEETGTVELDYEIHDNN